MGYRDNMDAGALAAWDRLVSQYGNLDISSAYRSPKHNANVGGAKHSQHMSGKAFDVGTSGMSQQQREALIASARDAGFRGIGVYDNSLHFDVGGDRAWGSDYTRNSLPEWAGGPVSSPVGQHGAQLTGNSAQNPVNALTPPENAQQQQVNTLGMTAPIDVRNFLTQQQPAQMLRFT